MAQTVLCVAPHPDDETLGCGGTLLRHIDMGDAVHWYIFSEMREPNFTQVAIQKRKEEIKAVAKNFGFKSVSVGPFECARLDTYPISDLVDDVGSIVKELKPDIIYLPYRDDAHSDHKAVFDSTVACAKWFRFPSVKSVRAYETVSETEFGLKPARVGFRPNLWMDVSAYMERKIEIMRLYESEIKPHPFPRSEDNLRALATIRGASSGFVAAEAFEILKEIR